MLPVRHKKDRDARSISDRKNEAFTRHLQSSNNWIRPELRIESTLCRSFAKSMGMGVEPRGILAMALLSTDRQMSGSPFSKWTNAAAVRIRLCCASLSD